MLALPENLTKANLVLPEPTVYPATICFRKSTRYAIEEVPMRESTLTTNAISRDLLQAVQRTGHALSW